jgi:hypothetical protein
MAASHLVLQREIAMPGSTVTTRQRLGLCGNSSGNCFRRPKTRQSDARPMISLAQDPDHVPIDGAGATQHPTPPLYRPLTVRGRRPVNHRKRSSLSRREARLLAIGGFHREELTVASFPVITFQGSQPNELRGFIGLVRLGACGACRRRAALWGSLIIYAVHVSSQ